MKKRYAVFIILTLLITSTLIACDKNGSIGVEEIAITKTTDKIVKTYGKRSSDTQLLRKESLSWLEDSSNVGCSVVSKMKPNDFVLDISYTPKNVEGREKPDEIYAMFDCWLELREKKEKINVVAITCNYNYGGLFDYDSWTIIIPYNEFAHLQHEINVTKTTQTDIAHELGDLWIKRHYYNRNGLIFDDNNKDRELVITPWRNSQISLDKEFVAHYDYGENKLSIRKINYYKGVSSSHTVWSMQMNESGYLYGVWDNKNNIWVCGEKTGLKLLEYNGVDDWTLTEPK